MGVAGSQPCVWYRSMWSVCSRRRLPSQARMIQCRERPSEFPLGSIRPRHLVARTMESRCAGCCSSQRPMISSEVPLGPTGGYTSAVSTRLPPLSMYWSSSPIAARSSASWPNVIVPSANSVTRSPVRPSRRLRIGGQLRQVLVADSQAFNRIAPAFVLLHDQPFCARLFTCAQDVRPVEVALAALGHQRIPAVDRHVLEVEERNPAFQLADPGRGVGAAVLQPVGVELGLQRVPLRRSEDRVQTRMPFPTLELEAVVVVREPQPRRLQVASQGRGLEGEALESGS